MIKAALSLAGIMLASQASGSAVDVIARVAPDIRPNVVKEAVAAMECAQRQGVGVDAQRLAIIDYTIPSRQPRMWVVDIETQKLLFAEHVAHGQGSGFDIPTEFSDREGSHQSSLGLFLTDNSYQGANGYSMRLHGLSKGYNESAMRRAIVMHGAWYVNPQAAASMGRLGRSWGCPAVRTEVAMPMIDMLKDGNFIYAHGPGTENLTRCGVDTLVPAQQKN
ncbi:MAG: murein L,D-transpeptidase catalytic domain family protein [Gammaproteobacteria bacterium]